MQNSYEKKATSQFFIVDLIVLLILIANFKIQNENKYNWKGNIVNLSYNLNVLAKT